jgi:hypothetical protein
MAFSWPLLAVQLPRNQVRMWMATIMHYLHVACDAKPSCWPQRSNSARPDGSLFQGDSRSQQWQLTSSNWRPSLSAHSCIANTLMHSAIWCASRHSPAAPHEGRISLSRIQNSYFSSELQCSTLSPCWNEFLLSWTTPHIYLAS